MFAAIAFVPALAALRLALPPADGSGPRRRFAAGTGLTFLSLFFLLAWLVIDLSSGPL